MTYLTFHNFDHAEESYFEITDTLSSLPRSFTSRSCTKIFISFFFENSKV